MELLLSVSNESIVQEDSLKKERENVRGCTGSWKSCWLQDCSYISQVGSCGMLTLPGIALSAACHAFFVV